jgi:IS30 family transposase
MNTLDQWCKVNNPSRRKSQLEPYHDEIVELYSRGYQIEQIQDFLKSQKVNVSQSNLYKFLSKNQNKKSVKKKQSGASKEPKDGELSPSTKMFMDKYNLKGD